jgi:hypothetical protein
MHRELTLTHGNREDKALIKESGPQKPFLKGGTSFCHQHARRHWPIYKKRCEDAEIPVHHWAIPRDIWNKMERQKNSQGKPQATLDHVFEKLPGPREFTRDGILHAVAQLVACDDQVD